MPKFVIKTSKPAVEQPIVLSLQSFGDEVHLVASRNDVERSVLCFTKLGTIQRSYGAMDVGMKADEFGLVIVK